MAVNVVSKIHRTRHGQRLVSLTPPGPAFIIESFIVFGLPRALGGLKLNGTETYVKGIDHIFSHAEVEGNDAGGAGPQQERNIRRFQNRIESYHQLRTAVAKVGGKKELTGKNDIETDISNQCGRLISNAIVYYNSAILSRLLERLAMLRALRL